MLSIILTSLLNSFQSIFSKPYSFLYGVKVPMILDPQTNEPSVTITFSYIFFISSLVSLFFLHKNPQLIAASVTTVLCWAIATILYMIRKLHKAKIDLESRSIELESNEQSSDTPQHDASQPQ